MHEFLDAIFSLFGKKAPGQVLGAAIVGALVAGLYFLRTGERSLGGEFSTWLIGGAIAGLTAGLILVSPRVFFGTFFGLLGLAVTLGPLRYADGTPVPLSAHAIKVAIGAGFMFLSIILFASRLKSSKQDTHCKPDGSVNGSQPIRSETNRTSLASDFRH